MKKELLFEEYSLDMIASLCGIDDENLSAIREYYHCELVFRDGKLLIIAQEDVIEQIEKIFEKMVQMVKLQNEVTVRDVLYLCKLASMNELQRFVVESPRMIGKTIHGKLIYPKTIGQRYLHQSMIKNDIVFACGPAGTGKTYLAVVHGVNLLKKGEVKKIILTRPAVEAGENLGFLPGDLKEKVDPYLRPLYDALYDTLGKEQLQRLMEKEVIEIAPLAYMRGRTLDHAFIILDEAQNTTKSQMKMFLTRMGFHSKIVITGDITQIDLIKKSESGLLNAKELLSGIKGIGFCELTSLDVVRHPLVQMIIERYERFSKL